MKSVVAVVGLFGLFVSSGTLCSQVNPRGTASMEHGKVTIEYGRPSAKGRDVFSMIRPDFYWRMGADAATKLETEVTLVMGEERVPQGEYTLLGHFVTPEEFYLVVAEGVSSGQPDDVVARAEGSIVNDQDHVEQMTIELEGSGDDARIVVSWGSNRIRIPFKVAS